MDPRELNKLKKFLKPLIRECIKEAIFEEGVLSALVAEVATGMGVHQITESNTTNQVSNVQQRQQSEKITERMRESKNKMLDAIGRDAYRGVNIFEGTEPLSSGGKVGAAPSTSPLANIDPSDKGVNIDGLLGAFGRKWDALK